MGEERSEYNDGRDWENIEFVSTTADTEDITVNIAGSGSETATTKYLNKGSLATGFVLRPSATVTVVQINEKVLRNPITVSTAGLSISKHMKDLNKLVIRTTEASTIIRLLVT